MFIFHFADPNSMQRFESWYRKHVVATRIEVPGLCPETGAFLSDTITKYNIGVKLEKRDFLENIDCSNT